MARAGRDVMPGAGGLWQQGPQGPAWALGATALLSTLACGLLVACGREEAHSPGVTVRRGDAV
jgi:hypothetical protein